jgi:RNA polymerase sigma-70 factor (ECF subfamily)
MDHQPDESTEADADLDRAWRDHRRHLLDVAFRILGNIGDAEDAVQEGFARLAVADLDEIDNVGGWLVVVVSRVCLDRLRAERRRPSAPDDSLERLPLLSAVDPIDPAERVTLDDTVRIALHLVLERLTPAERTAFVLHDVFQYPFDAISEIVGRSPAACRQLASRARQAVGDDAAHRRFVVESPEQRKVTEQFMAACATGDLAGLLAVLDPAVAGEGGGAGGQPRVVSGPEEVGSLVMHYLGPESGTTFVSVPAGDESGIVVLRGNRVVSLVTLTIAGGRVVHLHALVDPVKLAAIAEAFGR